VTDLLKSRIGRRLGLRLRIGLGSARSGWVRVKFRVRVIFFYATYFPVNFLGIVL